MKISLEDYERIKGQVESLVYLHRNDPWHKLPMVSYLAKKFMTTQDNIIGMAEDSEHLDIVAGLRSGGGIMSFAKGEQRIEWYQD